MKVWTKEEIRELLDRNNVAVIKGLVRIYEFQTDAERIYDDTIEDNGVGFSGIDGEILTSIANQFLKWGSITEKQFAVVKKKMVKYAGQLTKIANDEIVGFVSHKKIDIKPTFIRKSKVVYHE